MRKVFLTFTVFAMIVSITISVAHACVDADISHDISISQQLDDVNSNNPLNTANDCSIACDGCCVHHLITSHSEFNKEFMVIDKTILFEHDLVVSDLSYGLKRPPKS